MPLHNITANPTTSYHTSRQQ